MKVTVGIDIGGSTTKICGFCHDAPKTLLTPKLVRADDPVTSAYGAFGKFTVEHNLSLEDIDQVMMTGVGSSFASESLFGLPCQAVPEFSAVGLGGLYLSGLDEALVVSMGTGTAMVHAKKGEKSQHLGGTGVGGGTLAGLAKLLLNIDQIQHLSALAETGDLHHIDWRIGDAKAQDIGFPMETTASNFGNVSDLLEKPDIAIGILNMVYETIGMMAIFAARSKGLNDIVLTGNLAELPYAKKVFPVLSDMFGVNFIIPENAAFATVVGTALSKT
ncbi:MAG: type II pantothenate kinase [Clostridia bacterium]|nr:type II pantothenate kinase [Clostridia bacterium]